MPRALTVTEQRALGLVLGVAVDAAAGDPRRHHPVAGYGRVVGRLERNLWRDATVPGVLFAAAATLPVAALASLIERTARRSAAVHVAVVALSTWAVVGTRSLVTEGTKQADYLERGDLPAARARLPHLCGRDAARLDEAGVVRAVVESLAENCCDAGVAALAWGAVAGTPGLLTYRAINTLDAMVGHRSPRYARFGTASARLDDLANLMPARVTGLLGCLAAPLVGGSFRRGLATMLRDAGRHPSPNSGWPEAAWAGVLGVRLGGPTVYAGRSENRGPLGDGPPPTIPDVRRATQLVVAVSAAAVVLAAGVARAWSDT